ncbi:MAG: hypothetical protein JRJ87_07710 [Deltaproteobacteria bacterium]|nr:hypothetical protein [Deltaproteobacteria bacterium]
MAPEKFDYLLLATSNDDVLEEVMLAAKGPDPESLAGWEFKGFNSMDLTTMLGFRKFKKGFYKDGGEVKGYNVKVKQNGLIDPWIDTVKKGNSVKHGWYDVYPVRAEEVDNQYPNALLLNYNADRNPKVDPSRVLRDYLVQVDPDNPDLLLGKAFVAAGKKRVFVSYFILGRENESTL